MCGMVVMLYEEARAMDRRIRSELVSEMRITRRDLMRAIGLGGAVAAAGAVMPGAISQTEMVFGQATTVDPEIEQLAFDLDLDVESIFRFVADQVRYDAYSGILRG